jgi:hypothetical protein
MYQALGNLLFTSVLLLSLPRLAQARRSYTRASPNGGDAGHCSHRAHEAGDCPCTRTVGADCFPAGGATERRGLLRREHPALARDGGSTKHGAHPVASRRPGCLARTGRARPQEYEESLALAIELGIVGFIPAGLKGLGCVAAARGQYRWAALLWGAAEPLPESQSVAVPQPIYEHMRAAARAHLGESAFAQQLAEGRAMTPAQAVAAEPPRHPEGPSKAPT